tara:strand:+ start:5215 stop:5643 length:429 start_codon:yes stop_codon:yes gene_type:complete
MADQGFIVNDAEVTAIGTSYAVGKAIKLHADTASDANSKAMPSACYLSHLEIQLLETSTTVSNVSAFLCWDATGNDPLTAEAVEVSLHDALTTASTMMTAVAMDVWIREPAAATSGEVYLFLKVDSGAVTLKKARLYWVGRQ